MQNKTKKLAEANSAIQQVFNEEWVNQLTEKGIFAGDPADWKITHDNIKQVLATIQVNVSHYSNMVSMEIKTGNKDHISYKDLCSIFQEELAKAALMERKAFDDTDLLLKTPAQNIIALLREIQVTYLASDSNEQQQNMIERINYAIDKISQRTIFDVDYPLLDSLDLAMQRRPSVTKGWLREYSKLGLECLAQSSIRRSLYQQRNRAQSNAMDSQSVRSHNASLQTVHDEIDQYKEYLATCDEINFNMFDVVDNIGRKNCLTVTTVHLMNKLGLDKEPQINHQVLPRFLGKIQKGYQSEVQYHNELHAIDVLQMAYLMLTKGEIRDFGKLTELDTLSVVIASVCHDYGHDGFNNAYHVNAITDRAIRYSDQSVQENFHIAESFSVLNAPKYNFLSEYSRDDFKTFRKRLVGIILATDMARHASDLANFKNLMEQRGIKNGANQAAIIDTDSPKKEFDTRQTLLEMTVHAADVSTQVRPFDIAIQWTWLLFEEFFEQGDKEKEQKLPVSFLCDRTTTCISTSQPGFMNFIVVPLFATIADLAPQLKQLETNAKENAKNWSDKQETDKEKLIYTPNSGKAAKNSTSTDKEETKMNDSLEGSVKSINSSHFPAHLHEGRLSLHTKQ